MRFWSQVKLISTIQIIRSKSSTKGLQNLTIIITIWIDFYDSNHKIIELETYNHDCYFNHMSSKATWLKLILFLLKTTKSTHLYFSSILFFRPNQNPLISFTFSFLFFFFFFKSSWKFFILLWIQGGKSKNIGVFLVEFIGRGLD